MSEARSELGRAVELSIALADTEASVEDAIADYCDAAEALRETHELVGAIYLSSDEEAQAKNTPAAYDAARAALLSALKGDER